MANRDTFPRRPHIGVPWVQPATSVKYDLAATFPRANKLLGSWQTDSLPLSPSN